MFQNLRNHDTYWEIANVKSAADPDGVQGVRSNPLPTLVFKYPVKRKLFALSEAKLFHFHGIFKKNEINTNSEPSIFIHMNPLSRNPRSDPVNTPKLNIV